MEILINGKAMEINPKRKTGDEVRRQLGLSEKPFESEKKDKLFEDVWTTGMHSVDRSVDFENKELGNKVLSKLKSITSEIMKDKKVRRLVEKLTENRKETFIHSTGVCELALLAGIMKGLKDNELLILGKGALLHDIGKLDVPESILLKSGKPTDDEWNTLKQHPAMGAGILILEGIRDKRIVDATLHHHERNNGRGYPDGLKGSEISPFVRIISAADAFDAMRDETRTYQRPKTVPNAMGELFRDLTEKRLSSEVITTFAQMFECPKGTVIKINGNIIRFNKVV